MPEVVVDTRWCLRALAISLCLLAAPVPGRAQWSFSHVDGQDLGGTSLRVDAQGMPLFAEGGSRLRLARYDGSWRVEEIEGFAFCGYVSPSLALDAASNPLVGYVDFGRRRLKLARYDGAAWSLEEVAAAEDAGSASLALDPAGLPLIAFTGAGGLELARWDGAAWRIEVVDPLPSASDPSLALDRTGSPLIGYFDAAARDLKLARWTAGAWSLEAVDSTGDVGQKPSLAVDAAGNPFVAYEDATSRALKLARGNGAAWTLETVTAANGPVGPSLALDGAGLPLIALRTSLTSDLWLARWTGSAWSLQQVDTVGYPGWHVSLALDAAGNQVISYQNYSSGYEGSYLARGNAGVWTREEVQATRDAGGGSIAIDPAGNPVVSYIEVLSKKVHAARWTGSDWLVEALGPSYWGAPSVALDAAGRPVVAYDGPNGELVVARWDGSMWRNETVDSTTRVITDTSIAVDGAGNILIAYLEFLAGQIKLARFNGTTWRVEVVDTAFAFASLALTAGGLPAIAYLDAADDITLARWDGTRWQIQMVAPSINGRGYPVTVALDAQGDPWVSYGLGVGPVGCDLKLARWNGATWDILPVADAVSPAGHTLELDAAGHPVLAYSDPAGADSMTLARFDGTTWSTEVIAGACGYPYWLALDAAGRPALAFIGHFSQVTYVLGVAQPSPGVTVYRGTVADLSVSWKPLSLPLSAANDDPTPPFPVVSGAGGATLDPIPAGGVPLILYRVLTWGGDAGNVLKVTKGSVATTLRY